ncbi:MAG: GPW/gp25 family protein [Chloroflexales bacterium]|nr:GPW/gp25 family protein [Chloroflexales bacterium]
MDIDPLGSGFAFPLHVGPRGGIAEARQAQKIRDSIRVILGTQHGERLMRPTFGCNLRQLAFAPNTRATASLARYYVEEGLSTWEPRIILDEVLVENDLQAGCLRIQVSYRIKSTYEPQSLVYPFYLERR